MVDVIVIYLLGENESEFNLSSSPKSFNCSQFTDCVCVNTSIYSACYFVFVLETYGKVIANNI